MKKILYLVLILIIAAISYLKWQNRGESVATTPAASPSPTATAQASDNQVLTTDYFSLTYPKVATSSPVSESPDSTSWSIRYMGEKQASSGRTQTELFDGYAITVTVFPTVVGDEPANTQAESDRQGTIDGCGESSVTKIKNDEVAGNQAISFTGGCIGEATNFYFMDKEILFRISTMAVGEPEDVFTYQQTVDQALASVKLLK
ncbi:hypothetical protein KBD75_01020 [Candidatus Woesebacteria bacterium]|nr:hypothetical protein [Candidatus Woesebacteria bacterium]